MRDICDALIQMNISDIHLYVYWITDLRSLNVTPTWKYWSFYSFARTSNCPCSCRRLPEHWNNLDTQFWQLPWLRKFFTHFSWFQNANVAGVCSSSFQLISSFSKFFLCQNFSFFFYFQPIFVIFTRFHITLFFLVFCLWPLTPLMLAALILLSN